VINTPEISVAVSRLTSLGPDVTSQVLSDLVNMETFYVSLGVYIWVVMETFYVILGVYIWVVMETFYVSLGVYIWVVMETFYVSLGVYIWVVIVMEANCCCLCMSAE